MYYKYNDYELIYLVNEGVEEAFNELIHKYTYLLKKIHRTRFSNVSKDDFIQEGLMVLTAAIRTFNPLEDITFFSYFSICLNRKLNKIYEKNKYLKDKDLEIERINDKNIYSYRYKIMMKEVAFEDSSMSEFFDYHIVRGLSLKRYCKLSDISYEKEYYKYKKIIKELRKKVD